MPLGRLVMAVKALHERARLFELDRNDLQRLSRAITPASGEPVGELVPFLLGQSLVDGPP